MFKETHEIPKKLFEILKSEIVAIVSIERLSKTRNEIFFITTATRKFFAEIYVARAFNYVEELLYQRLKNSPDKKFIIEVCRRQEIPSD